MSAADNLARTKAWAEAFVAPMPDGLDALLILAAENVRFADPKQRLRVLAVTSALPQEGKSTTTCNLGVVLAQGGNRTLIADADMRRPSAHQLL